MPRDSLKGSSSSLKSAAENVNKAGKVVKAMKVTEPEPEPEPQPVFSDGPASAAKTVCSGIGIHTAIARQTASFTIEAFDEEGIRMNKGGTPFFVAVRGSALVKARLTDNGDGTCLCEYRPSVSGNFSIAVSLHGVPLAGSPFPLQVLQPRPDPPQCLLHGEGLHEAVARERTEFFVEFVDKLGQVTHAEDIDVWVEQVDESEYQAATSGSSSSSSSSTGAAGSPATSDADATGTGSTAADGVADGTADGVAAEVVVPDGGAVPAAAPGGESSDAGGADSSATSAPAPAADATSADAASCGAAAAAAVSSAPGKFQRIDAGERQQHLQLGSED